MAEKIALWGDREGKPVYADAFYVELNLDGKIIRKSPAKVERIHDDIIRLALSETSQVRKTVQLADLRVDFGSQCMRATPAKTMEVQKEYKPVFGVAKRGHGYNATSNSYWEPIDPTNEELLEMQDGEKGNEDLLAEIKRLRAQVETPKSSGNEFAIMSDKDLHAHAKSLGVKLKAESTRAEIIKAIEEVE